MTTRRPNTQPFLTVIEVARAAGVEAHVVRFYARTGLIRPARHAANGYRQFVPFDVKRVRFVRAAQGLGFTLAEITEVMRRSRQHQTPCPLVRDIMARRLTETAERLASLQVMHDRMQGASKAWRQIPDQVPRGSDICSLIESVVESMTTPVRETVSPRRSRRW